MVSAADTNNTDNSIVTEKVTNDNTDQKVVTNEANQKNVNTEINKKENSQNYTNQAGDSISYQKSAAKKEDPKIILRNVSAKTMTNVTFVADFPKDATGNVVFKLNTRTLTKTKIKVANGTASYTFKIPAYSAKNYSLMLSYSGNYKYQETKVNATLTLTKLKTTVSAPIVYANQDQVTKISAKVTNELNMPVETKVAFKVNGKTIGVVMSDNSTGVATLNYTFTKAYGRDWYNITYISGENNKHQTGTLNSSVRLYKKSAITINPVTATTGTKITLTSNIVDINNKKITTGNVTYIVNGKTAGVATVNKGTATLNYQLPKINGGKYVITATYNKNNVYAASSNSNTLTVNKLATKLTAYDIYVDAGGRNGTNIIVVDQNSRAITDGTVTISVNNKVVSTNKIKNGAATYYYSAAAAKSSTQLPFKVVFKEDGIYKTSSYTGYIKIISNDEVYVSPNGNDNNIGGKATPFKTVKKALSTVNSNGVIYLNQGEYREAGMSTTKSVTIQGLADKSKVIINAVNQNKPVFTFSDTKSQVTLNKLTIGNSNIKSATNTAAVISKGTLNVENSVFSNNIVNNKESSGAIHSTGTLNIINSSITNNKAYNSDGGAVRSVNGKLTVSNSNFTINLASGNGIGGAAIFAYNSNSTITNSLFDGNVGNGTNSSGGAIKVAYGNCTIEKTTFNNNAIKGATQVVGGAVASLNTNLYILNNKFIKNQAIGTHVSGGAGLYDQNSILLVYNTSFTSNAASGQTVYGGAIYNYNAYSSIVNTNLSGNTISANSKNGKAYGGAINYRGGTLSGTNIMATSNKATGNETYAGAIYFSGSKLEITTSSFLSNIAQGTSLGAGGAIFTYATTSIQTTSFTGNKATGPNNGGGAIANIGNLTASKNNFINNAASAAGSAISNGGKVTSINGNYWGTSSPSWSTLLSGVSQPSSYSKTKL